MNIVLLYNNISYHINVPYLIFHPFRAKLQHCQQHFNLYTLELSRVEQLFNYISSNVRSQLNVLLLCSVISILFRYHKEGSVLAFSYHHINIIYKLVFIHTCRHCLLVGETILINFNFSFCYVCTYLKLLHKIVKLNNLLINTSSKKYCNLVSCSCRMHGNDKTSLYH